MSCLLDGRPAEGKASLYDHLFTIAESRLIGIFGYLATQNPRVKFLVYSRGRLFTMLVPGGAKATFRDPAIAEALRTRIRQVLAPALPTLDVNPHAAAIQRESFAFDL